MTDQLIPAAAVLAVLDAEPDPVAALEGSAPSGSHDQAIDAMLPHARRIVDVVHSRDRAAVDAVLRVALAIPLPPELDRGRVLLLCLAELALATPEGVDDVAVERAVAGNLTAAGLNPAERAEAIRQLWTRGWSLTHIGDHLRLSRRQVASTIGNSVRHRQPPDTVPSGHDNEGD